MRNTYRHAYSSALRDLRKVETPNLTMRERNRAIRANARAIADAIERDAGDEDDDEWGAE